MKERVVEDRNEKDKEQEKKGVIGRELENLSAGEVEIEREN